MSIKSKKIINKHLIKEHFDKLASDRDSWIKKSKGFYFEDIKSMQELIPKGSSILAVHTGGLQGNKGMNQRFGFSLP